MLELERYRHFKGDIYIKLCEVIHTETLEVLVVYHKEGANKIWCRPRIMFYDQVKVDGEMVDRFKLITEK